MVVISDLFPGDKKKLKKGCRNCEGWTFIAGVNLKELGLQVVFNVDIRVKPQASATLSIDKKLHHFGNTNIFLA